MNCDEIEIRRLQVETYIGVPDEERANPQRLWVSVWMHPSHGFERLQDNVDNTVNYAEVAAEISQLALAPPRHLIETLAEEIAELLLNNFPLNSVEVKVEKKILPNADFVAVKITRSAQQ